MVVLLAADPPPPLLVECRFSESEEKCRAVNDGRESEEKMRSGGLCFAALANKYTAEVHDVVQSPESWTFLCVIPLLAAGASSRNLGKASLRDSVDVFVQIFCNLPFFHPRTRTVHTGLHPKLGHTQRGRTLPGIAGFSFLDTFTEL